MEKFDESIDENSYFNDDSECVEENLNDWRNNNGGTKDLTYLDQFLTPSHQPIIQIRKFR